MSKSTDPDHFFQTTHSLAETSRKAQKSANNHGHPHRLSSKILAVHADPSNDSAVYIAESAGTVRRLVLEVGELPLSPPSGPLHPALKETHMQTGSTSHLYRGPTAPLTSVALSPSSSFSATSAHGRPAPTLFAGCWDKSIWSWSVATRALKRRYYGHADFVKAVLCFRVDAGEVLVSGGADASVIVWRVEGGEKVWVLKGHTMGVLDLAVDPGSYGFMDGDGGIEKKEEEEEGAVVLFSAGSDRSIRRWSISGDLRRAKEIENEKPILVHETSVYRLCFDANQDLWTASADGSVKCLSRERGWAVDTTLEHGDYVRAVAVDEVGGWVVSAGRDEDVKVWDKSSAELKFILVGHFEEITGLLVVGSNSRDRWIVSVGIDATIRRWKLDQGELGKAVREVEDERNGVEKEEVVDEKANSFGIDEDEQRELDELMNDSG